MLFRSNVKISIFGESHGAAIGCVIEGLPSGVKLDLKAIDREMRRRAPGNNPWGTARKEGDRYEIKSGYFEGRTTGTPLMIEIPSNDLFSKDYSSMYPTPRPGHADFTGRIRYKGFEDYRGGGHFSGRLTAPLVFAGAIAKQILQEKNIKIASHIVSIENILDKPIEDVKEVFNIASDSIPVIDSEVRQPMIDAILTAKSEQDSVGGIVETIAINLPIGMGDPMFEGVENRLASILFGIPAVKGVEFGDGFKLATLRGSAANDEMKTNGGYVEHTTNHNGGILGGITNGMPLIVRVAIKPTASISKKQKTININHMSNSDLIVKGRHDPCIVPRAVPVIEAAIALCILDIFMDYNVF